MAKKKKQEDNAVPSPLSREEILDAKGIPMNAGNRKARRAMAKGTNLDANKAFNKEPIWQQMEHVMKTLKSWYAVNMRWLQFDPEAKAVLNDMHREHEEREQQIRKEVATALKYEHAQIDNLFEHALDTMLDNNATDIDEDDLEALVNVAKEAEHTRLDEVFARVEDQKILKNQLYSMQKEHKQLLKLSEIQTAKAKHEGKK